MAFWSMLMMKVHEGQAESSARAFIKRRAIEEAAESIPGFQHGELLQSTHDPAQFCVLTSWDEEDAYRQWLESPLRAKQFPDLVGLMADSPKTMIFQSLHRVSKAE